MTMTFRPFHPNGLQFIFGLMCLIVASQICVSLVSASSSDMLIIRHGRSRVRHSSEKNHIRWGLQAFDNLTLYDYDYETNATNGSNETLFGDFGLNAANQTFLGGESFGYFASEMVFNNVSSSSSSSNNSNNINNDSKLLSTLAPSLVNSNRWSASTLSTPSKNQKLAKKQIMENIRKNVEEGIEYLRTHAHLTQPTAVMPSERALLQLQKQAEQLTHEAEKQQLKQRTHKIEIQNESSTQEMAPFSLIQSNAKHSKASSSSPSLPSLPSSLGSFYHSRTEHNQSNQKKHKTNKQPLQWKTHQIKNEDDADDGNVDDDERIGKSRFADHNIVASNHFDYEIQNDEPNNENSEQNENHPYKSNKLNKSNARHAHEPSSIARSKSIATIKDIDSLVAAVSRKYLNQAINNSGIKTNLNGNSNATKVNLRSQSNSKIASRLQSANEMRKDTQTIKISDMPISSVASLVSQQHNFDSEMTKPNDSTQSKVKSNANSNQYETNNAFVSSQSSSSSASSFDDNELNDEQQSEFTNDDSNIDDSNTLFTFDEQTITIDDKTIDSNDIIQLPFSELDLDDFDKITRDNRRNLQKGRDVVTRFLQIVESQHLLGANCTAGTALNLGEGVVDRYAQDRFQIEAEVAVNRANMLTRLVL